MRDKNLHPTTDTNRQAGSEVTGPRRLSPDELSAVAGGKGDDDYDQVHYGPGYVYGPYYYQRHPGVGVHF